MLFVFIGLCPKSKVSQSVSQSVSKSVSQLVSQSVSQSVSQYVLVSSPLWDMQSDIIVLPVGMLLSGNCCLVSAGALSDERTGLQFAVQPFNGPSRSGPVTLLYCLIWDSSNLEGQVPKFISPRRWVAQLYPWALGCEILNIPHYLDKIGSQLAVRLSSLRTVCALFPRNIIFLLLILISVKGWVNPRA
jgi:hypothetical protein